ncbi:hypothetical protein JXB41_06495 [Candidatus Woesearchaeota archaeon]|nr:hypothetical protein [Candidatus Woesearchaeota archaeon]
MSLKYIMLFISAFLIGVLSTLLFVENFTITDEPATTTTYTSYVMKEGDNGFEEITPENTQENKNSNLLALFGLSNEEKDSPYDWIKENQIKVTSKNIVINIENAEWATFTDTNSMDPVIDEDSHAIEIIPESPQDIHVGDIVSYDSKYSSGIIIHRVVKTGFDNEGWYAVMKGDNNPREDPGKVRFSQIKRVLVAIIY